MSSCMKITLDLNLQRFASVKIVTKLWAHPDINKKVLNFFVAGPDDHKGFESSKSKSWWIIVLEVMLKLHSLKFPGYLLNKLKGIVIWIGDKIHSWGVYAIRELKQKASVTDLYWTQQGSISEIIYFQDYLKDSFHEMLRDHSSIHKSNLLCIFAETQKRELDSVREAIEIEGSQIAIRMEFWKTIADSRSKCFNFIMDELVLVENQHQENITRLSLLVEKLKGLEENIFLYSDLYEKDNPETRINTTIFLIFVFSGFLTPIMSWWSKMTENEQQSCLAKLTYNNFLLHNLLPSRYDYLNENFIKTIIFLLERMTDTQRQEFLKQHGRFWLEKVLSVWPYFQEYFIPIYEEVKFYLTEDDRRKLFLAASEATSNIEDSAQFDLHTSILTPLGILWHLIKVNVKEKIILNPDSFSNLIFQRNIIALKLLLNDKDLQKHREKMLRSCKKALRIYVQNNAEEYGEFYKRCTSEILQEYNKKQFRSIITNVLGLLKAV